MGFKGREREGTELDRVDGREQAHKLPILKLQQNCAKYKC